MWTIHGIEFESRLLLGSGGYSDLNTMAAVHEASATQMVSLALRQPETSAFTLPDIIDHIDRSRIRLLPTTAGSYTAEDAVTTAQLAAERLQTTWIKLDVTGNPQTLFPCMEGTLEAARQLVKEGFTVLPSCSDDPVICERLADIGCAAILPLASVAGNGRGLANPARLEMIRHSVKVPMIIAAGIRTASEAAQVMELGVDAVLVRAAITDANQPTCMARAMKLAVEAGRCAFESVQTTPKTGAIISSATDTQTAVCGDYPA
jgi:thiazole synthase